MGDAYLVNSEVNADFKLSLHPPDERHPTDRCHLSYAHEKSREAAESGTHPHLVVEKLPEEFAKAKSDGYGRFDDVWAPIEIAPGLVMPFRIGLPDSELRAMRTEVLAGKDVRWLPAPGEGQMIEVAFTIASIPGSEGDIPGSESMGNQLLLRHAFSEHRTLMIVWRSRGLSEEEQVWVPAYRLSVLPPSEGVQATASSYDFHRVMVAIRDDANGSRAFIDTAVV